MNNSLFDVFDNNGVRIALMGVLSILALFLLAETINLAADFGRPTNPATDTITVQGTGIATLPPDIATISFSVQNTAPTVTDAQEATIKQANAALDYVHKQEIEGKDIQTLSYNISPQYSYPTPCVYGAICPNYGTSKITGYQVSETVQVKVRDLTKVGDILAGLGKLEVQNINGPAFALDDSTAGYDAARADAIEKAKAQAVVLANQLGVHLGKIVNFSESSGGYAYPVMYKAMDSAMGSSAPAAPSIATGENTYNASVSITYAIR